MLNNLGLDVEDVEMAIRFTEEFYNQNKDFITLVSDSHGQPTLQASHRAPTAMLTAAMAMPRTSGPLAPVTNSVDAFGCDQGPVGIAAGGVARKRPDIGDAVHVIAIAVGMADAPCYLSPDQMVELERRNKLLIASHTAILKKAALVAAGGFIPGLKWHCDWFAIYVAGFRDGICFVPEPLAVFNAHATSYYTTGRRNSIYNRLLL